MKLTSRLSLAAILFLMMNCVVTKRSGPIVEDGVVVQTILRPDHYHHDMIPVTTVNQDGSVSVSLEQQVNHYGEQHWVVFACQHGQFAVENFAVWSTVSPGMMVKIRYRQIDTYKGKTGQEVHIGTEFEFDNAWPSAGGEWNINDVKVKK